MKHRRNQSGVALVITLIMLSVITVIAVAFLALSQRERASLSQTLTGTEAELMTSTGLERAKSHALAEVTTYLSTNTQIVGGRAQYPRPQGTDLAVSQAFTNRYTLYSTNWNMGPSDYEALTNLVYDPQVPVFTTNRSGNFELVDYLDLNRNGRFDPTGLIDEIDRNGNPTGNQVSVIGDPQWIGVLARPNEPHSSSNRFVGRYAYIILPAGRTLDINFIHNRGKVAAPDFQFMRSQGHGSWEINLAAFLADLNNNNAAQYGWGGNFSYTSRLDEGAAGPAFQDAADILNFRYAGSTNLWNANNLFGSVATNFQGDYVDEYANGGDRLSDNDVTTVPWPGSPNPKQFFSVHDLFNPQTPSIQQFQNRLRAAGRERDTYNQNTFYRMLAQLGTDSAPEPMQVRRDKNGKFNSARINLNYDNLEPYTADQFTNWTAETFFHTVADKLLQQYRFTINNNANFPLSVTNLPVYPTNYYTPAVHRILQMTMNIFEATTTNHPATGPDPYPYYPTALKPVFTNENGGNVVKIMGYVRVPRDNWAITNALNWKDLSNATHRASLNGTSTNLFVYGVPVLIGARKGFPNFNEYIFQTVAQVERKVQITKEAGSIATTNQAFFLGISNVIALEAWNSYKASYPRTLTMVAGVEVSSSLTNNEGFVMGTLANNALFPGTFSAFSAYLIAPAAWRGDTYRIPIPVLPATTRLGAWTNETFLPYSIYARRAKTFVSSNNITAALELGVFPNTQWVLTTTNRLRFFMFDDGHLIDAVGLAPQVTGFNITAALDQMDKIGPNNPVPVTDQPNYWLTNRWGGAAPSNDRIPTEGLQRQIITSEFGPLWPSGQQREVDGFHAFIEALKRGTNVDTIEKWAPFVPHQQVFQHFTWEANDPLVHHIAEDLNLKTNTPLGYSKLTMPEKSSDELRQKIGLPNTAYKPWAPAPQGGIKNVDPEITDPNVLGSDSWDFPTNKFATIGMLGRIHRGTPWQTIYLKSGRPTDAIWKTVHLGGTRSNPINDWQLADVFTVAQHPNASRGRLSVNQTNVAAWSAILSGAELPAIQGVGVVTNIVQPVAIDPNKAIERLVEGINARRGQMTGQVFSSISDFLSVSNLTMYSPFVPNRPAMDATPFRDYHFEAIPEKILSLVHAGDRRFVIYAFGQSLKPAPQSIVTGGPYRGLVTNYEVSGELATRTVMRVELDERNNPPAAPLPRAVVETFNILPPD
jgi:hypothetical protein